MAEAKMTSVPYSQRIRDAVRKLEKATEEDKLNHPEKAYVLYMEALEEAGVCLFFDKDLAKDPEIKKWKKQFEGHYERATKIRDVQERSLSHGAKVGLGLVHSCLKSGNVKLDDVGGLDTCKKLLKEAAILPIEFPDFFTASNIVSKWMGEGEKQVSNLFRSARDEAPSIIFIDEIDSLCGPRGNDNEHEASRRIKTEFLVHMQAVSNDEKNVLVLAATNTPYHLDVAMRRRFDKQIYIPLPDLKAREQIFKLHIGETPNKLSPEDFQDLASKTDGFSGSDVSICVKDALYQSVRATLDAEFFRENSEGMWVPCKHTHPKAENITIEKLKAKVGASKIQLPPIKREDFDIVLKKQRPTVSKAEIDACEKFTEEFGIDG